MWSNDKGGQWLERHRKEAQLTLRELSLRCGVQHATISNLERGVTRASVENIDAMGRVLGFTLNDYAEACGGNSQGSRAVENPGWGMLQAYVLNQTPGTQNLLVEYLLRTSRSFVDTIKG